MPLPASSPTNSTPARSTDHLVPPPPVLPTAQLLDQQKPQQLTVATIRARSRSPRTSWEEPHPGRRLSYPMASASASQLSTTSGDGCGRVTRAYRGGMAAKGWGHGPYYHTAFNYNQDQQKEQWLVRRAARLRTRNAAPKPLKIPTIVPEEREIRSAPLPAEKSMSTPVLSPLALAQSKSRGSDNQETPSEQQQLALEVDDTDTDTELGTTATRQSMDTVTVVATPSLDADAMPTAFLDRTFPSPTPSLYFTDFSHHIYASDREAAEDDGRSSMTFCDPDAYSHLAPDEDVYGWEAELEQKLRCDMSEVHIEPCSTATTMTAASTADLDAMEYKCHRTKTGGHKRSLLHRVFSLGPKATLNVGDERASRRKSVGS